MKNIVEFSTLTGKTISRILYDKGSDRIEFVTNDGVIYNIVHFQEFCEQVVLEDIVGDLEDLIDSEIILAKESKSINYGLFVDKIDWVFYSLTTNKGTVVLKFSSNTDTMYSTKVNLIQQCNVGEFFKELYFGDGIFGLTQNNYSSSFYIKFIDSVIISENKISVVDEENKCIIDVLFDRPIKRFVGDFEDIKYFPLHLNLSKKKDDNVLSFGNKVEIYFHNNTKLKFHVRFM